MDFMDFMDFFKYDLTHYPKNTKYKSYSTYIFIFFFFYMFIKISNPFLHKERSNDITCNDNNGTICNCKANIIIE